MSVKSQFSSPFGPGIFFFPTYKEVTPVVQRKKKKAAFIICDFLNFRHAFHIHSDLMESNNQLMALRPAGILFCPITWNELLIGAFGPVSRQTFQSQCAAYAFAHSFSGEVKTHEAALSQTKKKEREREKGKSQLPAKSAARHYWPLFGVNLCDIFAARRVLLGSGALFPPHRWKPAPSEGNDTAKDI